MPNNQEMKENSALKPRRADPFRLEDPFGLGVSRLEGDMDASTVKTFKLDASGGGCSGMFWRTKPEMSASTSSSDWPRNGTILKGWYVEQHPGWVKIDHAEGKDYWMPVMQHGKNVMHEMESS